MSGTMLLSLAREWSHRVDRPSASFGICLALVAIEQERPTVPAPQSELEQEFEKDLRESGRRWAIPKPPKVPKFDDDVK